MLRAVILAETQKDAAHDLGISYQTVKNTMHNLKTHAGEPTITGEPTLFSVLIALGWLQVPPVDDLRRQAEVLDLRLSLAALIGRADALLAELG